MKRKNKIILLFIVAIISLLISVYKLENIIIPYSQYNQVLISVAFYFLLMAVGLSFTITGISELIQHKREKQNEKEVKRLNNALDLIDRIEQMILMLKQKDECDADISLKLFLEDLLSKYN